VKGRSVLLDRLAGRRVAALLADGVLDDLLADPAPDDPLPGPGAIARALAARPVKGMGGLFVTLPGGASGFLRGAKPMPPGQPLLVQVIGRPEAGKAVPVTTRLLFKSRHAIVTPDAPGLNVSRAIRDEALRADLAALAEAAMAGSTMGLILRSAAGTAEAGAVAEDVAAMRGLAEAVCADVAGAPEWLTEAPDAHHLAWRDWGAVDEVDAAPGCLAARGALDEIAALARADVALPGGGRIWVEATRACVAVDVDTGGEASPAAGLTANIAALRALPRALRLRGLGGQVVVDLAPMPKKDRRTLEQVAKAAFRACPVETSVVDFTALGHLELQRKRERAPLDPALTEAAG